MSEKTMYKIVDWTHFSDVPTRIVVLEVKSREEASVKYIKTYYPDVDASNLILVISRVY